MKKQNNLAMALLLREKGIPCFPVNRLKVALVKWKTFQKELPSVAQLEKWFSDHPTANLAAITGQFSGIVVVDADTQEAMQKVIVDFPETTLYQRTGKGLHAFYAHPEGQQISKRIRFTDGIDLIAGGGYITVFPSIHQSGKVYQPLDRLGKEVKMQQFVEMLDKLPTLTRATIDKWAPEKKPLAAPGAAVQINLEDIPENYWAKTLSAQEKNILRAKEGSRNDVLNRAAFIIGQYSRSDARCENAFNVLLEASSRIGLPHSEAEKTITSGLYAGMDSPKNPGPLKSSFYDQKGPEKHKTINCVSHTKDHAEEAQHFVSPPIPFGNNRPPRLDPSLFPPVLADFAMALSENIKVCPNFALATVLTAASIACQSRLAIRIEEDFVEPTNLFISSMLESGERKSPTVRAAKKPILNWQQKVESELIEEVHSNEAHIERATGRIAKLKKQIVACEEDAEAQDLIKEMVDLEMNLPIQAKLPKVFFDDCTVEALAEFMESQRGIAAHFEAEGGFFDILKGRYNDNVPNLDLVLKAHNQEEVTVKRKGKPDIILSMPSLVLAVFPQPSVVKQLSNTAIFRDRGLLARFLFIMAESRVGKRLGRPEPISQRVKDAYARRLHEILWLGHKKIGGTPLIPSVLELSEEALDAWWDFHDENELELDAGGVLFSIKDWGGKLLGAVARISGIFHACKEGASCVEKTISKSTMMEAIALGRILSQHALYTFENLGMDENIECAKAILKVIERKAWKTFTRREAHYCVKGRYPEVKIVQCGLDILETNGYIKREKPKAKQGRPSVPYVVSPYIYEKEKLSNQ